MSAAKAKRSPPSAGFLLPRVLYFGDLKIFERQRREQDAPAHAAMCWCLKAGSGFSDYSITSNTLAWH
ncbi:hypothetical protein, partial [Pseudomonas syringae]|uniref:hypothetical protein n=1 Tax=Pseudomonas syringae TaxID=317 RepID=UPI001F2B744F